MIFRGISTNGCTICHGLIAPRLLWIFTLELSGEIQLYLFLSVGTDAQWHCQVPKKGKCLFLNTKDSSDSLESKMWVLERRGRPHRFIKSPCTRVNIAVQKRWHLAWMWFWRWIRPTLQLYSTAWRPDFCWMTSCYALLVFLLSSSFFSFFQSTFKDMDFNYDSCFSVAFKCMLVLLVILWLVNQKKNSLKIYVWKIQYMSESEILKVLVIVVMTPQSYRGTLCTTILHHIELNWIARFLIIPRCYLCSILWTPAVTKRHPGVETFNDLSEFLMSEAFRNSCWLVVWIFWFCCLSLG